MFRTNPQDERFHEVIQQMVDLTCSSITGTSQKQQHQSQQQNRALQPTVATTSQRLSSTNLLHDFDKASQDVISGIMQSQAGSAPVGTSGGLDLSLNRQVSMPELRRLKRDFMKLLTQLHTDRLQDVHAAKRMFLEYLQTHVH